MSAPWPTKPGADAPLHPLVGGWTLLSRLTGFARDVVMAAVLGAGGLMDVSPSPSACQTISGRSLARAPSTRPSCRPSRASARRRTGGGGLFQGRILSLLVLSQIVLLRWRSPSRPRRSACWRRLCRRSAEIRARRRGDAHHLPVPAADHAGDALVRRAQCHGRFAVAAAAPVLLNISLLAFVQMAFLFKTPAHAAGWGSLRPDCWKRRCSPVPPGGRGCSCRR